MVFRQTDDGLKAIVLPTWAWSCIGAILFVMLGGTTTAGTWVATSIVDHEKRVAIIESTRFTSKDAALLVAEQNTSLRESLREIQADMKELRKEVIALSKRP